MCSAGVQTERDRSPCTARLLQRHQFLMLLSEQIISMENFQVTISSMMNHQYLRLRKKDMLISSQTPSKLINFRMLQTLRIHTITTHIFINVIISYYPQLHPQLIVSVIQEITFTVSCQVTLFMEKNTMVTPIISGCKPIIDCKQKIQFKITTNLILPLLF